MKRFRIHNQPSALKALLILLYFVLISGCQTSVLITSDPPGSSILDGDKVIGVTPLTINVKELKEEKAGGHLIAIEKSGYDRVLVWLPGWLNGLDVSINLKPFAKKSTDKIRSNQSSASRRLVYANTASLFKMQNKVISDQDSSSEVLAELDEKIKDNPNLGSLTFLKAVVLARQQKESEAKELLIKAMQMSPREYDFLSMYNILGGEIALGKNGEPVAKPSTPEP